METTKDAVENGFRKYLPDLSLPRFVTMQKQDPRTYAAEFLNNAALPWLYALWTHWRALLQEPFKGVTTDGVVLKDLFKLQDEGIPIEAIVQACQTLLESLNEQQRQATLFHIDSPEWRTWSNPEFLLSDKGIRLEDVGLDVYKNVLGLLEASLSPEGYNKAVSAMRINGFLGELVGAPAICNDKSYNLAVFGHPSVSAPWGYSFYGHHLCLNLFFYKSQIIISPWFTGAEPNLIDDGPYKGTTILRKEEELGLRLMQQLPPPQQAQSQIYADMHDPAMPVGRWNRDDQRHLCGAYQDNRTVPYEGILVSSMEPQSQRLVREILAEYLLYLPHKAREIRLDQIVSLFNSTYFCWIGGFGDGDAFYYRIQSPVIVVEFDHHSGVFLNNPEPAHFHIHTLLRTPNAGDYGRALLPLIPGANKKFVWNNDDDQNASAAEEAGHQGK